MNLFLRLAIVIASIATSQFALTQEYYKCGYIGDKPVFQDYPCDSPNTSQRTAPARIKSPSEIQLEGVFKEALNSGDFDRAHHLANNAEQRALVAEKRAQAEERSALQKASKPKRTICKTAGYASPYGTYSGTTVCREK